MNFISRNLITNLGTRMSNTIFSPAVDFNLNVDNSIESCFRTDQSYWPDPNTFILGVDLEESYFTHTILLVTDLVTSWWNGQYNLLSYPEDKHRFQRFEIYVGDNSDYRLNEKVEGGPFIYDPADPNDPDYWTWGKEIWVNM